MLLLVTGGRGFGQSPAGPAFEVASIKPTGLDLMKLAAQVRAGETPAIGVKVDRSRATYTFMSLKELIVTAYDVKPFQISGPDFLNDASVRWDIVAKMPDGATPDQAPKMLQALLAERFKLALHRETKEMPVMALVVASGGPKLQEVPADSLQDFDPSSPLKPGERQMDTPQGPVRMTVDPRGGAVINMGKRGVWTQGMGPNGMFHLEAKGSTMSAFADMLTQMTTMTGGGTTQIVDMTGLKGNYVVSLDFSLADLMKIAQSAGVNVPMPAGGDGVASDPGTSSSITDAVRALGLKLESRKAPGERLIIDHVEKTPTNN
jgi:uncharacterized protein (TIGR03435 family)